MLNFNCPSCGKSISVKEEHVGKRGKCPGCGAAVTVPVSDDDVLSASGDYEPPKPVEAVAAEIVSERPASDGHESPIHDAPALGQRHLTTSGLATASLITGIPGLCCFPIGIVAIVLGIVAIKEINDSSDTKTGKASAVAGISCGSLGAVLALLAMLFQSEPPAVSVTQAVPTTQEAPEHVVPELVETIEDTKPVKPKPKLTYDTYLKLTNGMTFDEVKAIIGGDCEELSRVDIPGAPTTVMYSWKQGGFSLGNCSVTFQGFQGGKLVAKAQFELR